MDKDALYQLISQAKLTQVIATIQEQLTPGSAHQKKLFLIQQGVNMIKKEQMLGIITSGDFQKRTKDLSSELIEILEEI